MLVLTRKPGQRIMLTGDISITVIKVQGNKAMIGIDAPEEVSVKREEINEPVRR